MPPNTMRLYPHNSGGAVGSVVCMHRHAVRTIVERTIVERKQSSEGVQDCRSPVAWCRQQRRFAWPPTTGPPWTQRRGRRGGSIRSPRSATTSGCPSGRPGTGHAVVGEHTEAATTAGRDNAADGGKAAKHVRRRPAPPRPTHLRRRPAALGRPIAPVVLCPLNQRFHTISLREHTHDEQNAVGVPGGPITFKHSR